MCYICRSTKGIENINLYFNGSEGVNLCHSCRMFVTKMIIGMAHIGTVSTMRGFKIARKEDEDAKKRSKV